MSLNQTPSGERTHIGFFGKRNAGKSSLVNAVTGQDLAVVSEVFGTTTDPVQKAMELLPLGPVMIIDTPGIDDEGYLGEKRVRKTKQILNKTDIAVIVIDGQQGMDKVDNELTQLCLEKNIPYIVVYNKSDIATIEVLKENEIAVSAIEGIGIYELKEKIAHMVPEKLDENKIVSDLLNPADFVVLVVPIDTAAPKGRLILPQQQTIRDILEADATAIVVKENELIHTFSNLGKKPAMVITDSQVFAKVSADTPSDIPLTSFSILMARYKGFLDTAIKGVLAFEKLKDEDRILISEGCSHHRQCEDIGTVKLPKWITEFTGKKLHFFTTSGREFPEDLSSFAMIVHCGGCTLNEREMTYRMKSAIDQGIPFTNYGIAIAHIKGILRRSISIFPDLARQLEE